MIDKEDYRCIVCGGLKESLIVVECKVDAGEIFLRHRGICKECLLNPDVDINKLTKEFRIKKLKEQIEKHKEGLIFWENELDKLNKEIEKLEK